MPYMCNFFNYIYYSSPTSGENYSIDECFVDITFSSLTSRANDIPKFNDLNDLLSNPTNEVNVFMYSDSERLILSSPTNGANDEFSQQVAMSFLSSPTNGANQIVMEIKALLQLSSPTNGAN